MAAAPAVRDDIKAAWRRLLAGPARLASLANCPCLRKVGTSWGRHEALWAKVLWFFLSRKNMLPARRGEQERNHQVRHSLQVSPDRFRVRILSQLQLPATAAGIQGGSRGKFRPAASERQAAKPRVAARKIPVVQVSCIS